MRCNLSNGGICTRMSPRKRRKAPKVKDFVESCLKEGITSPSEMRDIYNEKYPLKVKGKIAPKSSDAFRKAIRRLGVSAEDRLNMKYEAQRSKELRDIEDYPEVKQYVSFSTLGSAPLTKDQVRKTLSNIRTLWNWMSEMGYPNPYDWDIQRLGECMEKHFGKDQSGGWNKKNRILDLWGAFNRCFQGKLPKGWSCGLKRPAGELKDFFEFEEMSEFLSKIEDTEALSVEGWKAVDTCQVSAGAREGTRGDTGILSLKWEDINYNERRCSIRDKGSRGKRARLWTNVPLDLFSWLHSWELLIRYHKQRFGYIPTQSKHEVGRCFPVTYDQYRKHFHATRKRCTCRINQDLETLVPHIFRKTHAQYAKRIGISLENLCGDTKGGDVCDGRYGVGWSNPDVPLKYYLTKEDWEYEEQDAKIEKRMKDRVLPQLREKGIVPSS